MSPEAESDAAIVEAVIYLENEPLEARVICSITGLERDRVEAALASLQELYRDPRHGMELVNIGGLYSIAPKPELAARLQERYGRRNESRLSRAALETLSIVAYSQPITRAEIEAMRGVAADGMLKLLMARDLVAVVGKRDAPGRPAEYGTTREFLKLFRLSSIAELPKLDETDREKYGAAE